MMDLYAGIDIGSASTKVVLLDNKATVVATVLEPSGIDFSNAAEKAIANALNSARAQTTDIVRSLSTGYGRACYPSDRKLTEITCHAKAGYHFMKKACTVLDIGGQDTKAITIADDGTMGEFRMNRKCAAGTGAFLEEMARRLGFGIEDIHDQATQTDQSAKLSSFCTVFAMTEVLKRIHEGASGPSLARGVYEAMVDRTLELVDLSGSVAASGGVVHHHPIFVDLLSRRSNADISVVPLAQFAGAFGAALLSLESV